MSGKGRPPGTKRGREIVDALLSIWTGENEILPSSHIHKSMVDMGYWTFDKRYSTCKWLKKAISLEFVEKVDRGIYRIIIDPEEFRIFKYLNKIRETYRKNHMNFNGSFFELSGKQIEFLYLGMPEELDDYRDTDFILEILHQRVARIFKGIQSLSMAIRDRRKDKNIPIPLETLRQVFAEIIPWWFESQLGPEYDGYSTETLYKAMKTIIETLPDEIIQNKAQNKTRKMQLLNLWNLLDSSYEQSLACRTDQTYLNKEKKSIHDPMTDKNSLHHFAWIIHEPEFTIDEGNHHKRDIINIIQNWDKENNSIESLASRLIYFEEQYVESVLPKYVRTMYCPKKSWEILDSYRIMKYVDAMTSRFDPQLMRGKKRTDLSSEDLHWIERAEEEIGTQTFVKKSPWGLRFQLSNPEECLKTLFILFPTVSKELIIEWFTEGYELCLQNSELEKKRMKQELEKEKKKNDL